MGRKPKSAEVRARFFTARASGATLREAAAAAGISRTAGHYWLAQSGGVRPRDKQILLEDVEASVAEMMKSAFTTPEPRRGNPEDLPPV
jgi:hypothetical protein